MESARRYSPFAWAAAVALSASVWAGYLKFPEVSVAAFALSAIGIAAWIVAKWAGRLAKLAPVGESRQLAVLRAMSLLAFAVFALCAIGLHAWALAVVYPEPAVNRAYAESMGFDLGPYFLASLAASFVVAGLAVAAIRALRAPNPARAVAPWAVALAGLAGWSVIAAVLDGLADRFKAEWSAFGADLPTPTLLLLEFEGYRVLPLALALGLLAFGWFSRSKPLLFRWIAVAQLLVLLLASAFFTLAIASAVLPVFKMCGAV